MDPLEEQLVKLSLLNSRPLPQRGQASQSSTESLTTIPTKNVFPGGELKSEKARAISPKKVGPLVPPKPHKKIDNFPEIPQSSLVKQICEPLYSQRLQCLDSSGSPLKLGRPPILQRKQPLYAAQGNLYSKTSRVTLDNPAILDQQLEALAHHKKQLEKKRLLLEKQQQGHGTPNTQATLACIPKLSSTSLISDTPNSIYSNMRKHSIEGASVNIYKNFGNFDEKPGNIYSNLIYEKENSEGLPPPTTTAFSAQATPTASGEYLNDDTNQQDDELPPPPSPVSSSYSELRRAADVFAKKNTAIKGEALIASESEYTPCNMNKNVTDAATGIAGDKLKSANNRQTYINVNYNNDYSNYSPTLHSISQDSTDYYGYGSFSQGSSTYESIYEPINPRPPSQSSIRSNYIMYVPYLNGPQNNESGVLVPTNVGGSGSLLALGSGISGNYTGGPNTPIYPSGGTSADGAMGGANGNDINMKNSQKEAEVETLTDFLVNTMDSANDVDSYGVCFKCNERVMGENSGCTAMDQIYHITCFTCSQCQINLQGKPFYALDNKPYCEYDYLQTLEKCSVCMKPILERILRATGKPYHPQCFTCVVCGKSLDGIPFTVDATNQNYCIADFHKKFAPRCCVCKEPIMPEPGEEETIRVVALDRSFHFKCYKCEDCGLLLSSEAEGRGCYPLDDHVLCKSCNAKRVQMLTNRMTTEL